MGQRTWTLVSGADRAQVSSLGGVITSWEVERGDGGCELIDGYADAAEHAGLHGYRNAVLAPWSNRIRQARFDFGGYACDLGEDADGVREALHGLISGCEFREVSADADRVCLACEIAPSEGYPFRVEVRVTYRLVGTDGRHRLELDIEARNAGDEEAPVTLGWHPYLRHLGAANEARVRLPGRTLVRTDEANVPLPGDAAFVALADVASGVAQLEGDCRDLVYADGDLLLIGPANLDHAVTDLRPDDDGWVRASLTHADGSRVSVEFLPAECTRGVGIFHVFTGEVLPERAGEALALEPCLAMTDAFNRDECAHWVGLAPGATRILRAGLEFTESAR